MNRLPHELLMFLAGAAGSAVFAFLRPQRESAIKSVGNCSVGTLVSLWTTPAICEWQEWTSPPQQRATAFVVGLLGMVACRIVLDSAESEAGKELGSGMLRFVRKIFGKGDEGK